MSPHMILFLVINGLIAYLVHKSGKDFYKKRIENGKTSPKVFDVGHRYLPNLSKNKVAVQMNDLIALFPLCASYFFGIKIMYVKWITLVIIRWITTAVTILPKDKSCDDSQFTWLNFLFGHCYDKIFSGHFATTFLFTNLLFTQGLVTSLPLLVAYNLIHAFIIISTRSHYTIDLLISILAVRAI